MRTIAIAIAIAIIIIISLVSICDATENLNRLFPNRRSQYTWGNPYRTISFSYFYDYATFGRNANSQTGNINGGTVSIPFFYNSADRTVEQLFGSDNQIYKLGILQTYLTTEGKKDDAWVFEFKARLEYEGFKHFRLSFYDDTTENFIVSFEKHFSSEVGLNDVYECRWPRDVVSDKSGFDNLVSKLKIRENVEFFLEFLDAPEVLETTITSTFTSFTTSSPEPASTSSVEPVSTSVSSSVSVSGNETSYPDMIIGYDGGDITEEKKYNTASIQSISYIFLGIGIYFVVVVIILVKIYTKNPRETTETESETIQVVSELV